MALVVFLDACVLFPSNLRDVILSMAEAGMYQLRWSPDVLEEMERNLIKAGKATPRLRNVMEAAFPDAMVLRDEYQEMLGDMPNDEKDRHVLAAAIATQADVLVTANLKDFKPLPDVCEVEIQHPDDFLCAVLESSPGEVFNALKDLASRRHKPMNSIHAILNALHKTAPNFVMQSFDILPRYNKGGL
ncbi:PIN domain-containing protein [Alicyclobacillus fodiniaquatilis]|uniref:PIN domain-containing protein n=1 Tax=Alicyclobacillus fodiniaquatilis TaxID=1661150 RepID=A0ABW4JND8_9BACL